MSKIRNYKDVTGELLKGSPFYLKKITYIPEERLFALLFFHPAKDDVAIKEVRFQDITYFEDTIDDYDPTSVDQILGIHSQDKNTFVIRTEQREIVIKTAINPTSHWIQNQDGEG